MKISNFPSYENSFIWLKEAGVACQCIVLRNQHCRYFSHGQQIYSSYLLPMSVF